MTSPRSVGDLPSVVSKAGAGRARDSQPKGEAVDGGGEKDAGFGELLSKMKRNDDAPATDDGKSAKAVAKSGERPAGQWHHEVKTQPAARDADAMLDADAAADAEGVAAALSGGVEAATQAQGAGVGAVNDLAAALGAAAAPTTTATAARVAQGSPAAQASRSTEAALAALEAKAQAADGLAADDVVGPDALDAQQRAVAGATLANAGARVVAAGKDKAAEANDADALLAQSALGAAVAPKATDSAPAAPKTKATVVRQETHFAPVVQQGSADPDAARAAEASKPGTGPQQIGADAAAKVDAAMPSFEGTPTIGAPPAQQIADRIATEAPAAPAFAERLGAVTDQANTKPALKVLHIALQPGDLGTVTVRMELKDAELKLHVEAERAETAEMIRNDQDTLSKLLRSAGYAVDAGGGIRVTDSAAAQPGQNGTQGNPQSSQQSQSGASERQGHASRGNGESNNGDSGQQPNRNEKNETTDIRAGVGVYI